MSWRRIAANIAKLPGLLLKHGLNGLVQPYFNAPETLEKVVFRLVPIDCTAATITIEMKPAISAYSMAVAPASSLQN
jgi:hypothetical protein